jgi:hypothetical protein
VGEPSTDRDYRVILEGEVLTFKNNCLKSEHWQLMPISLATQETEIRRIAVQGQPGQIVHETLS